MNNFISTPWRKFARCKHKMISRHAIRDYRRLVRAKLREHPGDRQLALAQATGSATMEIFRDWGDRQVEVLRHHGLRDNMSIYDLGCGSGRTAQALTRAGWRGSYRGADIIQELVEEININCPAYEAFVHEKLTIRADDESTDMLFHWSVFTHLYPEECYIYMTDIYRALKPGGKLLFSFIEMEASRHEPIFDENIRRFREGIRQVHLNQFLHRDWIRLFAAKIGFSTPEFTDGSDATHHSKFGQSLAAMLKPSSVAV